MAAGLEAALVRILTTDRGLVGAGFFIAERSVLTCANVVLDRFWQARLTIESLQRISCLRLSPGCTWRSDAGAGSRLVAATGEMGHNHKMAMHDQFGSDLSSRIGSIFI